MTNSSFETDLSPAPRGKARIIFAAAMALLAVLGLALGTWQVQRLFWKLDLIERTNQRVQAAPVTPPPPGEWSLINAADYEYRHVRTSGTLLNDRETLVQAVTERGPGFWVVTPLVQADGTTVLINRGFVPADRRDPTSRAQAQVGTPVEITGLLRMTEPAGGFLRSNDPAGDRWYSRDVAAIASARNLENTAPYFIDADATANPGGFPIGGLTVIQFRNSHLTYALTWYVLALMCAAAAVFIWRGKRV